MPRKIRYHWQKPAEEAPPGQRPFPTPFDQIADEDGAWGNDETIESIDGPYTLQEIAMLALSYEIRNKPDWERKYLDPTIRAKWKEEALAWAAPKKKYDMPALTENMIDYVLDELALHDKVAQQAPHGIRLACFTGIYESDTLVPADLRDALLAGAQSSKRTRPTANQTGIPSLVYDVDASGTISSRLVKAPAARAADHSCSDEFQWLPADFEVNHNGKVKILSYINNLHPEQHESLYPVLAGIFERFVPAFERVLSDLQLPPTHRISFDFESVWKWHDEAEKSMPDFGDEWWDKQERWEAQRPVHLPEPEPFSMPATVQFEPVFPLKGRKLQVIVKLANIHLTPEKPDYPGGVWHVEGMQNEEIVTSGIYYFDQDNIGESTLAFRGTFDQGRLLYAQNDHRGVQQMYGVDSEGPLIQNHNSVRTSKDRAIVFPNVYQHRVSPFSLVDRSKPGYRKILCFFLVDPLKTDAGLIISTSRVPPQQFSWLEDAVWDLPPQVLDKLPHEIWEILRQAAPHYMSFKKAKRVREDLMEERKYLHDENKRIVFERPFSLCEH
ncbi:Protein of unknown function (DUF4246)-domain containing protein [Rhodotorula toruloides]|uniref:Uncharacterized protein n=1 Tax=Rhodotorula toruloides TaxID=5286 RepID=A0A2T0A640_RHOTO|nr:Protein of unknown function (DUF4246)-domain containing protein [Rhodotorula toruloides]